MTGSTEIANEKEKEARITCFMTSGERLEERRGIQKVATDVTKIIIDTILKRFCKNLISSCG